MNDRFILPIAVAVAAHATLLLGARHTFSPIEKTPKTVPTLPPITIRMEPEKPEIPETNDAAQKGRPDVDRPSIEDTARPLKPLDFAMDTAPVVPRISFDRVFSTEPPGRLDGIEGGVKLEGSSIISSGLLDNAPNTRVQASPDYPFSARRDGLTGEVMVEFVVDETGRVLHPVVVRSTDRIFEAPSINAVLKWRFEPGKRDGRVVKFRMAVPIVFGLDDK